MISITPVSYRVLSIDPGATTGLGLCVSLFTPDQMVVEHVTTIHVSKAVTMYDWEVNRYDYVRDTIIRMINDWQISEVVAEDIFCNPRLILAYRALVLTLNAIRQALLVTIGGDLPLFRANVVKNTVGVASNTGDKLLVSEALAIPRPDLHIPPEFGLKYLDEHSNDAVAIGYTYYKTKKEQCYGP